MKNAALLISTSALLLGCATGPSVQVMQTCPRVPPLILDLPQDALEHNFIEMMQQLLSGKLPLQPDYSLLSAPALQPIKK